MSPLLLDKKTKKAMESIAPILEGFIPKTSASENTSLKLPPSQVPYNDVLSDEEDVGVTLQKTLSRNSQPGTPNDRSRVSHDTGEGENARSGSFLAQSETLSQSDTDRTEQDQLAELGKKTPIPGQHGFESLSSSATRAASPCGTTPNSTASSRKSSITAPKPQLPKIGKIGVCAK